MGGAGSIRHDYYDIPTCTAQDLAHLVGSFGGGFEGCRHVIIENAIDGEKLLAKITKR